MANPMYNTFMNMVMNRFAPMQQPQQMMRTPQGGGLSINQQVQMVQKDPGAILDILFRMGKINQQEYIQLQPYKNNPQEIYNFLMKNGHSNELGEAQNEASNFQQNFSPSHSGAEDSAVN